MVDVFGMVADSAFEPKNYVSSSVGMYKNARSHQLENFLGGNEQFKMLFIRLPTEEEALETPSRVTEATSAT